MPIFGIGANYDKDVSGDFVKKNVAGVGHTKKAAPEVHQFIKSLKVGDIVYLKSASPKSKFITVKAIGVVADDSIIQNSLVEAGRKMRWLCNKRFQIPKPAEKNNVRNNTMYEEFHPAVQEQILNNL